MWVLSKRIRKYSPLDDINVSNVDQLEVAWTWEPRELPNHRRRQILTILPTNLDRDLDLARFSNPPEPTDPETRHR